MHIHGRHNTTTLLHARASLANFPCARVVAYPMQPKHFGPTPLRVHGLRGAGGPMRSLGCPARRPSRAHGRLSIAEGPKGPKGNSGISSHQQRPQPGLRPRPARTKRPRVKAPPTARCRNEPKVLGAELWPPLAWLPGSQADGLQLKFLSTRGETKWLLPLP